MAPLVTRKREEERRGSLWVIVLEDKDELVLVHRQLVVGLGLVLELDAREGEVGRHAGSREGGGRWLDEGRGWVRGWSCGWLESSTGGAPELV